MRELGKRMVICKPLIPKIKTTVLPQKQTRLGGTDENRSRIGNPNLFPDSDEARNAYHSGPYGLFSDKMKLVFLFTADPSRIWVKLKLLRPRAFDVTGRANTDVSCTGARRPSVLHLEIDPPPMYLMILFWRGALFATPILTTTLVNDFRRLHLRVPVLIAAP